MTLRALAEKFEIPLGEAPNIAHPTTTIAFALDYGYIEPLKVLLTSMIMAGTVLDCPVVIYTNDEKVGADPAIAVLADRINVIDGDRRDILHHLAKNNVKRAARADWNRGTFLKWAVFEEQGTEQLLFLDADMICIRPLEKLLAKRDREPLLCCPQVQMTIRTQNKIPRPTSQIVASIKALLGGKFEDKHAWRINSGMMLIRKPYLNRDFFSKITAYAAERKAHHEQEHLSNFFQEHGGRKMLSIGWNFQELFLYRLNFKDRDSILKKVTVLHYAGNSKPWGRKPDIEDRPSILVWHAYRTASLKLSVKN